MIFQKGKNFWSWKVYYVFDKYVNFESFNIVKTLIRFYLKFLFFCWFRFRTHNKIDYVLNFFLRHWQCHHDANLKILWRVFFFCQRETCVSIYTKCIYKFSRNLFKEGKFIISLLFSTIGQEHFLCVFVIFSLNYFLKFFS